MPSVSNDLLSALPRLRRYARILTNDPRRADDMVKETLCRAQQTECEPSDPALPVPLLSMLRSVYADLYAPGRARGPPPSFNTQESSPPAGAESSVGTSNVNDRRGGEVLAQLWQLPVEDREVLVLVAVERMSYEDIAALLAVPVATVLARVMHARESVRSGVFDAVTPKRVG